MLARQGRSKELAQPQSGKDYSEFDSSEKNLSVAVAVANAVATAQLQLSRFRSNKNRNRKSERERETARLARASPIDLRLANTCGLLRNRQPEGGEASAARCSQLSVASRSLMQTATTKIERFLSLHFARQFLSASVAHCCCRRLRRRRPSDSLAINEPETNNNHRLASQRAGCARARLSCVRVPSRCARHGSVGGGGGRARL